MNKAQVVDLLDADYKTQQRVAKLDAETGSVVREPVTEGPCQMLNGIDCAAH